MQRVGRADIIASPRRLNRCWVPAPTCRSKLCPHGAATAAVSGMPRELRLPLDRLNCGSTRHIGGQLPSAEALGDAWVDSDSLLALDFSDSAGLV